MSDSVNITFGKCFDVPVAFLDGKRFTLGELWQTIDQGKATPAHQQAFEKMSAASVARLNAS